MAACPAGVQRPPQARVSDSDVQQAAGYSGRKLRHAGGHAVSPGRFCSCVGSSTDLAP